MAPPKRAEFCRRENAGERDEVDGAFGKPHGTGPAGIGDVGPPTFFCSEPGKLKVVSLDCVVEANREAGGRRITGAAEEEFVPGKDHAAQAGAYGGDRARRPTPPVGACCGKRSQAQQRALAGPVPTADGGNRVVEGRVDVLDASQGRRAFECDALEQRLGKVCARFAPEVQQTLLGVTKASTGHPCPQPRDRFGVPLPRRACSSRPTRPPRGTRRSPGRTCGSRIGRTLHASRPK